MWQLTCRHVQLRDGVSAEYLWVRDASANCIDVAPVSHGARSPMSASLRCSADPSCEVLALGRATRDVSCPRGGASSAPRCFSLHCTHLASASFGYVAVLALLACQFMALAQRIRPQQFLPAGSSFWNPSASAGSVRRARVSSARQGASAIGWARAIHCSGSRSEAAGVGGQQALLSCVPKRVGQRV